MAESYPTLLPHASWSQRIGVFFSRPRRTAVRNPKTCHGKMRGGTQPPAMILDGFGRVSGFSARRYQRSVWRTQRDSVGTVGRFAVELRGLDPKTSEAEIAAAVRGQRTR